MEYKPVTIAILNWNSQDMLGKCIESVKHQTYPSIDLHVLDNASSDNSVVCMEEQYPDICLTVFETNLGFAKAHNRAIRASNAPYYMPLNPDVVLMPTYVAEMVKAIELDEHIGSVAGKLLFMKPDGMKTNRIYSTGHVPTRSRAPINRGYKTPDEGYYERVEHIFAANGAAPLYRRAMLEDVAIDTHYFYEDFFIYMEDHDLGWQAQLRGWKCLYTPYAVGYHVGFGSGGIRLYHVQVQFTRNRYLTLLRNDNLADFLVDVPYILLYELIWQSFKLVHVPKRVLAHWHGICEVLQAFPATLRTRMYIQQRRTVSPRYIRSFFVSQLW